MPASSEPSAFCGLYSRSTLANTRLTDSDAGLPAGPPCTTPVMRTSFILTMRYSCWPLPALRWVMVASFRCSPRRACLHQQGRHLVDGVNDGQVLEGRLAGAGATAGTDARPVGEAPGERQYLDLVLVLGVEG